MDHITWSRDAQNIATITFDMQGRSTNVLNDAFYESFSSVVKEVIADESITGIILASAKSDFVAGADLDKLYSFTDPKEIFHWTEAFKKPMRDLETCGRPVVAAMNGPALGGGLEVALSCHYRIALNSPKIRFGLPEITFGLLPGGGGCQRLPRMIGIEAALPMLLEGRTFTPDKSLKLGLVDDLAETPEELISKAKTWIEAHPNHQAAWDQKGFKWPGGSPKSPQVMQLWAAAPSSVNKKTFGNSQAAINILSCVHEGSLVDIDTALRIESRYFGDTVASQTAKNMISAFWYQLNNIKKGGQRPQEFEKTSVSKVGILGAGMMGAGIAYVSAQVGIDVVLKDVSLENAEKGKGYSKKLLDKKLQRGQITKAQQQELLNRIQTTDSLDALKGCDLIVEAVFEDVDLKATVTKETEAMLEPSAVFASNTSTLPISLLAKQSERPANFIGLHFFSPVDKMKLVEIIIGKETSPETLARAFDYVQQIKKVPIVVNDSRGFYTSRVFMTYVLEGLNLLAEGQDARSIESAGLQAGMPVGPQALSDEISLSLMWHILEQTRQGMEAEGKVAPQYAGASVVDKMVNQLNRQGKAAGAGLYEYPGERKKQLWKGITEHFPRNTKQLSQQEMMDRLMFFQVIEAIRCLEENVVTSVGDANIGSIFGWGFNPFKGGILQFANDYGIKAFAKRAQELADAYGERFQPPQLLLDMAAQGKEFR